MRSFGIVSPQFWTGRTGKEIQACGPEPIILAAYLMTSPHSHMCGLYYVSKQYIVLDTGRPLRAVEKAFFQLGTLPSGAFALYDTNSQYVWVPEMLRWQVGELKPKDGRIQGIINWYRALPPIPFVHAFFDRYSVELPGLPKREIVRDLRGPEGGLEGGLQAPKSTPALVPSPVLLSVKGGSGENGDGKVQGPHRKVKTEAPKSLEITDEMREWARENGIAVDLEAETASMLDWHRGKGNLHVDWVATWRTWMRKSKDFGGSNGTREGGGRRSAFAGAPTYKPRQ